jgi:sulfatase modifying factor 1
VTATVETRCTESPYGPAPQRGMVWIADGTFTMGSDDHYPEERPAHEVEVNGFWIDAYQVTNAQFRRFVNATGYITVAERVPTIDEYPGARQELLYAGSVVFNKPDRPVELNNHYAWWRWVAGANWKHPEGPMSTLHGKERHPVVHVAWEDVEAYAAWAGKSIPTEAEWEFACRGGLERKPFAWGDELAPRGRMLANYWQGQFPWQNLLLDRYERTAPVGSFPPNSYGLFDMIGNVWEWTDDFYLDRHEVPASCCGPATALNPNQTNREASIDRNAPGLPTPRKVLKGGSFACSENYCQRYRPAARMHHPIDTGTNHIGFRCVIRPDSLPR